MISRGQSLLVVLLVWAVIYLPALGSLEIKGEEGRRILPAITMLETGNYIVPQVGSERYFSKPPLVNWLVAASFKIFGTRNEWAARMPSTICVLAVAIAFVTIARASLGGRGSITAALIWMTNFGIFEKGRLIEIEGLYVSLFALAFVCWLSWWEQKRSPWLIWTIPWIFLGLGLLAKGPTHLVFFYAVVIAVLWQAGALRKIWNLPHALGLIIMLSIFAAWAIPYAQMAGGSRVARAWQGQLWLALVDFKFRGWIRNIPRSLGYFLPWLLLLPLVRGARFNLGNRNPIGDCQSHSGLASAVHYAVGCAGVLVARGNSNGGKFGMAAMARRQEVLAARSTACRHDSCDSCLRVCLDLRVRDRSASAETSEGKSDRRAN